MGFDYGSVNVQYALIDMYGKCGDIKDSVLVYKGVPNRNLEMCNSLMTSLLHYDSVQVAVKLFGLMVNEGIGFGKVSLSTTVKALSMSAPACLSSCTPTPRKIPGSAPDCTVP
ncbi:hypothetical protein LguiB_023959 [Lonicera macranthoides]